MEEAEAVNLRAIFTCFIEIGSTTVLGRELAERGISTSQGKRNDKKYFHRMLNNRAYIGEAVHKGDSFPGEHNAIIDDEVWDKVHAILTESPDKRAARTRADTPALLKGLLYGPVGAAFKPTHTRPGIAGDSKPDKDESHEKAQYGKSLFARGPRPRGPDGVGTSRFL